MTKMHSAKSVETTKVPVPALYKMLKYRRAHNSAGEKQFIIDFIVPLAPYVIADEKDEPMAFMVFVGKSDIMFTSHLDSVHMKVPEIYQDVILDNGIYKKEDNQPLGADDAAGVWLMLNMIFNNVPGTYMFFRGEERGGIGSSWCAKHMPSLFFGIKAAIAFDRKATHSIITHQGGGRGCSDEFALSLAKILDMGHRPDNTGVYTDTAELFDLVDNCTNVSVGYYNEHTKHETLNKNYIEALRDRLLVADWSKLDFTKPEPELYSPYSYGGMGTAIFDKKDPDNDLFQNIEVGPLDVADFLFDHSKHLPTDLQKEGLDLAQRIYKRFE